MNENEFSIALGADDGAGIGNVLSKTTRPDYPAETPTFSQKKKWREAWRDSLQTAGLAAVLRGEVPFELLKLQPRPLIPETDQSSFAGRPTLNVSKFRRHVGPPLNT